MARDIEEFLRRAAERRKQQQNKSGPSSSERVREIVESADVEVVRPPQPPPVARQSTRPATNRSQSQSQSRDMRHESVAEHVQSHIDTTDVSEHAAHLGERIQRAEGSLADRLRQKFRNDVSKIDDMPTVQDDIVARVTGAAVSQSATDVIRMLRNPESIRQAILISEILKRPEL